MQGYAWVTSGGIYMVLDGRWCKITSFRSLSAVAAGWGNWQPLHAMATANWGRPQFEPALVDDVHPGDFVRLDGPGHWARTTEVNTVLAIESAPGDAEASAAGDVLVVTADAAWLRYPDRVERLEPQGVRSVGKLPTTSAGTRTFRVISEVHGGAVHEG